VEVAEKFTLYLYKIYLPLAREWLPRQAARALKIWPAFEVFNDYFATEEFLAMAGIPINKISAIMEPRNRLLAQTVTKLVKDKLSSCFSDKLWCYAAGVVLTHEFKPADGHIICVGSATKVIRDMAYLRPENARRRGVFASFSSGSTRRSLKSRATQPVPPQGVPSSRSATTGSDPASSTPTEPTSSLTLLPAGTLVPSR
jgi:hypothetical protein